MFKKIRKGFTLSELLVAVIVLGTLIAFSTSVFMKLIDTHIMAEETYANFIYENMLDLSRDIKVSYDTHIADDCKSITISDYPVSLDDGTVVINTHIYSIESDGLYRDGVMYTRDVKDSSEFRFVDGTNDRVVRVKLVFSRGEKYKDCTVSIDVNLRTTPEYRG